VTVAFEGKNGCGYDQKHGDESTLVRAKPAEACPRSSGEVHKSLLLRLSSWLSFDQDLAGMDGNRTHPGRLSSAPHTVLKTAFLSSVSVHQCPPKAKSQWPGSADVR
jgi:hypothetical protein